MSSLFSGLNSGYISENFLKVRPSSFVLIIASLLSACAPTLADQPAPALRPTPTPVVVVAITGPEATNSVDVVASGESTIAAPNALPPASPTPFPDAAQGIAETLQTYFPTADPEGSKGQALSTLRDFADANGVYRNAWWFAQDEAADIYEVLAVVFYTEGNLNVRVQQAIAARYLWYCGGVGAACSGEPLINFLAYFQPWREPWMAGARFTSDKARDFLPFARDLVGQTPGLLTALLPGADSYVRDPDGLDRRQPIDWPNTPFHFANVHPSWDTYLRHTLGRGPNGHNRLWVLTLAEAGRVCPSAFVCENMTQEKK